jgi:hypothetical protein
LANAVGQHSDLLRGRLLLTLRFSSTLNSGLFTRERLLQTGVGGSRLSFELTDALRQHADLLRGRLLLALRFSGARIGCVCAGKRLLQIGVGRTLLGFQLSDAIGQRTDLLRRRLKLALRLHARGFGPLRPNSRVVQFVQRQLWGAVGALRCHVGRATQDDEQRKCRGTMRHFAISDAPTHGALPCQTRQFDCRPILCPRKSASRGQTSVISARVYFLNEARA